MFLVGVSSVEFSDCAQVDEDGDSVVLEDSEFDEEGEDWEMKEADDEESSAEDVEEIRRVMFSTDNWG